MRRPCLAFLVLAAAMGVASPLGAEARGKILMLLRSPQNSIIIDFVTAHEATPIKTALEQAGYLVSVATEDGHPLAGKTISLNADLPMAEAKAQDYVGIVLPCLDSPTTFVPDEAVRVVKEALACGLPIAAQCTSVVVLSKAGALEGKRYAMHSSLKWAIKEGIYSGEGVVRDGNILSSGISPDIARREGTQDGTPELTRIFLSMLP